MRSAKLTHLLPVLAAAVACALGGCNYLAGLLYIFTPESRTVSPEFDKLDGNTVAVVVAADDRFVTGYDYFREQVSMMISEELRRHLDDVKTVEASAVVGYQKAHPQWAAMPQTELARRLGADYLLVVTVRDYSLRPKGSRSLYHGHITADAELFDGTKSQDAARVFWSPEISADYPEGDWPLTRIEGGLEKMREELDKRFAQTLVRKFRHYKVKNE